MYVHVCVCVAQDLFASCLADLFGHIQKALFMLSAPRASLWAALVALCIRHVVSHDCTAANSPRHKLMIHLTYLCNVPAYWET